jgi:putative tryptophan/tyrosine transport system substrate-binding protein
LDRRPQYKRNINIEIRWATGSAELIQQFAKELVALQRDLLLSATTPTTTWLRQQTLVIPIAFANVSDPVGGGFVASLSRPGGNTTGFINLEDSMASKWLGLLKEIAPQASEVAFVFNPTTALYAEYYLSPFKTAARSLGVGPIATPVSNSSGLESAIAGQAWDLKGGPIVMPDSFTTASRCGQHWIFGRMLCPPDGNRCTGDWRPRMTGR